MGSDKEKILWKRREIENTKIKDGMTVSQCFLDLDFNLCVVT